jgi:lipopolysaccharide/colanic/teichoic acid biosynthesis glycosyltransferase
MIRFLDILVSLVGLIVLSPFLLVFMLLVWLQDWKSPFYLAPRVARGGGDFTMVKLRSMVANADRSGIDSTANSDMRITRVGKVIRKFKLDELTQLWNVLVGDMSLVGPRPQVRRDVDLYTPVERGLLTVLPGITDFASIVFSDEGTILEGRPDPDLAYNQLIRPWKSRLALFYIEHRSVGLNLRLVWLTALTILNREKALAGVQRELRRLGADEALVRVACRTDELVPFPPPGSDEVVQSRNSSGTAVVEVDPSFAKTATDPA